MINKKIVLIGGGGHCKSVIDTLLNTNEYDEICILDKDDNIGKRVNGIQIVGNDNMLDELHSKGYDYAFISLGSIGNVEPRIRLMKLIKKIGFTVPNIIDRTTVLSNNLSLAEGIFIGKNVIINIDATIGTCSIINNASVIEHDCSIGNYVHVSPGSVLCGGVCVGDNTHIGAGTIIIQNINIGRNCIIGSGSNVVKNIGDSILAYGNPCNEVNKI